MKRHHFIDRVRHNTIKGVLNHMFGVQGGRMILALFYKAIFNLFLKEQFYIFWPLVSLSKFASLTLVISHLKMRYSQSYSRYVTLKGSGIEWYGMAFYQEVYC